MNKCHIAYFSPLPPLRTGIADYNAAMLPQLAEQFDMDVYGTAIDVPESATCGGLPVFSTQSFEIRRRARPYAAAIYHIGNSPYHGFVYDTLLRYPGVTVLHELVLHHFFLERTLEFRDTAGYLREMGYNAGVRGATWARQAMQGHVPYPRYQQPLYARVVDASRVLVVHSRFVEQQIRRTHPHCEIARAPLGCDPTAIQTHPTLTSELRRRWHVPDDAFVVATFGRLDHQKRIAVMLDALRQLRASIPHAFALLVGEAVPGFDVQKALGTLVAEGGAYVTGYVPQDEFYAAFDLADVAVNLRSPTAGETSAAIVQMLGRGLPLVTSDVDAFAELPDAVAIKIPVVPDEREWLKVALETLYRQPRLRQTLSDAARAYIAREHSPERVAEAYALAVETAITKGRDVWRGRFQQMQSGGMAV